MAAIFHILFYTMNPSKPILYFAHANGFPADCYQVFFAPFAAQYEVKYLPVLAMNPDYPVTPTWHLLVDEVIADITAQADGNKVVGVGHSFGSLLLLMASYKRPELFEQVVLMDPPFLMGKKTALLEVAQKFKLSMVDRATPALLAVKRVDFWPSRDVAYKSLRHKSIFKRFDERCFQAYMAHGLVEDSARDGVTLRIPKALEADIFRTVPSWWWRTPKSPPQVPVHLLTASDSIFYQHGFPQLIQQQYRIPYSVVEGGHMFPLETPEATAAIVLEIIAQQAPASADQTAGLA